jgi:hypothetical protein
MISCHRKTNISSDRPGPTGETHLPEHFPQRISSDNDKIARSAEDAECYADLLRRWNM